MKDSLWFWILGGVLLLLVLRSKGGTTVTGTSGKAGTLPNANTAASAPAPWLSTLSSDAQATIGTASTVGSEISTTAKSLFNVFGLFGGASTASGTPSPATSGSGTGVVNNSSAGDNSGAGSPTPAPAGIIPVNVGYDQYGMGDFGGNTAIVG